MAWHMTQQQARQNHTPAQDTPFTLFSRFPKEVQDKIWEMAMRDNTSSFHAFFFKPYSPATDGRYSSECTIYGYNCENAQGLWFPTPTMTKAIIEAPSGLGVFQLARTSATLRASCWHKLNESMYLEDAGLWSASRGSRASMTRKHLLPPHHSAARYSGAPVSRGKTMSAAIMGSFVSHDRDQHTTFHIAKQDIVCIQCNWRAENVGNFEHFSHSIFTALQGVDNVAVEFDRWMLTDVQLHIATNLGTLGTLPYLATVLRGPDGKLNGITWLLNQLHSPILGLLKARDVTPGKKPRLWFIDLSLTRSQIRKPPQSTADSATRQRAVFEGRFCRFVEVRKGDWDWTGPSYVPSHRCVTNNFPTPNCGADCFLNGITAGLFGPGDSPNEKVQIMDWVKEVEFGILAVENNAEPEA